MYVWNVLLHTWHMIIIQQRNEDSDMKLSGYDDLGLLSSSDGKYIHNIKDGPNLNIPGQEISLSCNYPYSWPPIPDTILILSGNLPLGQTTLLFHSGHHGRPYPKTFLSGSLKVLQEPTFLALHSFLDTLLIKTSTKLSGYLLWSLQVFNQEPSMSKYIHTISPFLTHFQ